MDAPYGSMKDGRARLDMVVGITSFGYKEDDDDAESCSGDEPAIYTSVDYFLDWIEWIIDCHPDVRSEKRASRFIFFKCVQCSGDVETWQWKLTERRKQFASLSESDMISVEYAKRDARWTGFCAGDVSCDSGGQLP